MQKGLLLCGAQSDRAERQTQAAVDRHRPDGKRKQAQGRPADEGDHCGAGGTGRRL